MSFLSLCLATAPQALLNKSMPRPLAHITSLKHLTVLKLGGGDGSGGAGAAPSSKAAAADIPARFACPITGLPFNGKSRFVVLRRSGHELSERALKEVRCRLGRAAWLAARQGAARQLACSERAGVEKRPA